MSRNGNAFSAFQAMGDAQIQVARANHELAAALATAFSRMLSRIVGRFGFNRTHYV